MRILIRFSVLVCLFAVIFAGCSSDSEGGPTYDTLVDQDAASDPAGDGECPTTEPYCSTDRTQVLRCEPSDGSEVVVDTCTGGEVCVDGVCMVTECTPGVDAECVNETTSNVCKSDGSGWELVPCPEGHRCAEESGRCEPVCELRVFVLLDQSGSMGGDEYPTKWSQAQEAMAELMASEEAQEVEFGLGAFPTGESCGTSAQVIHPIPNATADLIDNHFGMAGLPSGATPLLAALEFHLVDVEANLNDTAYYNFILLISDGADTCYDDFCEEECGLFAPLCLIECEQRAEVEIIGKLASASWLLVENLSIRTFVIGFGSGVRDEELTAIAENGGTSIGRWLDAANVTELSEAFAQILAEMWECNPVIL